MPRTSGCLSAAATLAILLCAVSPLHAADTPRVFATTAGGSEESALYRINPSNGATTKIGDTGYYEVRALDFDKYGTLFGVGVDSMGKSVLIKISTSTGQGTLVGKTGISDGDEILAGSIKESTGDFWIYFLNDDFYAVDTSDGSASYLGYYDFGDAGSDSGLGFDSSSHLVHCRSDILWTVDTSDLDHTWVSGFTGVTGDSDDYLTTVQCIDWYDGDSAFYGIARFWDDSAREYAPFYVKFNMTTVTATATGKVRDLRGFAMKVNSAPVITSRHASPSSTAVGVEVSFSVTATDVDGDDIRYGWDFGDGEYTFFEQSTKHAYSQPGTYTVRVTASDGDDASERTLTVTVSSNSPPYFRSSPSASITKIPLSSGRTVFRADAGDPDGQSLSYSWDFGDGSTGTGSSPAHTYSASGDYTATVTVSDGYTSISDTVDVTVNTPPYVFNPVSHIPTIAEIGWPVDFTVTVFDHDFDSLNYRWDFDDGGTLLTFDGLASHTFGSSGTYEVRVNVDDQCDPAVSSSTTLTVAKPIGLVKVKGGMNFKRSNRDSFTIKGYLDLPRDYSVAHQSFRACIGGVCISTVELDKRGRFRSTSYRVALKYKKKASAWAFTVKAKGYNLYEYWVQRGMGNANISSRAVDLQCGVYVGGEPFLETRTYAYSSKQGKKGVFK